jgi:hypothetical protein
MGHIYYLKNKKLGDILAVVVATDATMQTSVYHASNMSQSYKESKSSINLPGPERTCAIVEEIN